METVIIVIHLMVIVALIAVVLVQRSEGGALGIGGSNNFLTSRGSGNVLTRATGILAAAFFATSLGLTILTRLTAPPSAILDTVPATTQTEPATPGEPGTAPAAPTTGGAGGILDELEAFTGQPQTPATPPATETPAPAPATPAEPQVPTTE